MSINVVVLKSTIEERMLEVEKSIQANLENIKNLDKNPPDEADRAEANINHATYQANINRLTNLKKSLSRAMVKMNSKDYGHCEECGVEIPEQRLLAIPDTTICVDCLTIIEQKQRHIA